MAKMILCIGGVGDGTWVPYMGRDIRLAYHRPLPNGPSLGFVDDVCKTQDYTWFDGLASGEETTGVYVVRGMNAADVLRRLLECYQVGATVDNVRRIANAEADGSYWITINDREVRAGVRKPRRGCQPITLGGALRTVAGHAATAVQNAKDCGAL